MRDNAPRSIYLKDYAPPEYLVGAVDLTFLLDAEETHVTARLKMQKNREATDAGAPLLLDGEALDLESLRLNGRALKDHEFQVTPESLAIPGAPKVEVFDLEIATRIHPAANTALEGLYLSGDMLCTQCEAQGFRRITYFPDRPDVMARYTTTLIGDKWNFPILLSNGNRVASGELKNKRHWVRWEDPYRKPCYLFALVAGRLRCLEDSFTTMSGREVKLQIWVEPHDLDKCEHAMHSLKHAMRWDETAFGREYDLDLYMIVAVGHFNMGAMENKGLNIFNTKYVLARPDTATDADYEHIEGVIGHEYFHNWTGNRITCRDWFQLSLKEGLTVFRDQEFTAERTSRAVKRIEDVNLLRNRQFAEDAGPLAHPVRPESYIEINNFYTLTVYEKGAEVIRMLHTLLGADAFRRGMDLYFARHDGQAVTCDDFLRCMEEAGGTDLSQFRLWYSQSGTPEVHVESAYDAARRELAVTVRQSCPATPGQPVKEPLLIPFSVGLLGGDGAPLPLRLVGEQCADGHETRVLRVGDAVQTFRFADLAEKPVLSALRGFSAPVRLKIHHDYDELAFLFRHDSDPFNRWEAGQQLAGQILLNLVEKLIEEDQAGKVNPRLVDAFRGLLAGDWEDPSYLALLLTLPSEDYIGSLMNVVDPDAIHAARQQVRRELARELEGEWRRIYGEFHRDEAGRFDALAIGRRRIKNLALSYIAELDKPDSHHLCFEQFQTAATMTDQIGALACIVNSHNPDKENCLDQFYAKWQDEALVIDKWFTLQAACPLPGVLQTVRTLAAHPAFDLKNPNRLRALVGAFCQNNPVHFHALDGSGYRLLAEHVTALNTLNPQIAARLLSPLSQWRRYDEARRTLMTGELRRIMQISDIARDVYEVASKSLG
ncbi:MAG TPA: aminopeptidase N [Methylococcaceae bacterium]|nr:aminopeptidase N [Methylococcaceae bacterium]